VHVLVVDDDSDASALLEAVLTYCGALVTVAENARDALARLRRALADVVVTDLVLPREDGYWLVREIRALTGGGRTLPVVALFEGREGAPERAQAAGFSALLQKPVDPWEFCRLVAGLARKP